MSTTLVRILEIKKNNSKGYIYNTEDLKRIDPLPGDTYFFVRKKLGGYKTWDGNSWVPTTPKIRWERLTWGGLEDEDGEKDLFYDTGGKITSYYLSRWEKNYEKYKERGIPEDTDPELKEILKNNGYNHTWFLVSELEQILDLEIERFKTKVIERSKQDLILEKLQKIEDLVLKRESDVSPQDLDPEETLEYLFEDDIWNLLSLQEELGKIEILAEQFSNVWKKEDIRVHYYFI